MRTQVPEKPFIYHNLSQGRKDTSIINILKVYWLLKRTLCIQVYSLTQYSCCKFEITLLTSRSLFSPEHSRVGADIS